MIKYNKHRRYIEDRDDEFLLHNGWEFSGLTLFKHVNWADRSFTKDQAIKLNTQSMCGTCGRTLQQRKECNCFHKDIQRLTIRYILKDITTINKGVILHGCNCSGGFGSGVASAIRSKFPFVYSAFITKTPSPSLLGEAQVVSDPTNDQRWFINGFTQVKFGSDGNKYADPRAIRNVVESAIVFSSTLGLPLYMPKIGCGLGGLHWETEVLPEIENAYINSVRLYPGYAESINNTITICELPD